MLKGFVIVTSMVLQAQKSKIIRTSLLLAFSQTNQKEKAREYKISFSEVLRSLMADDKPVSSSVLQHQLQNSTSTACLSSSSVTVGADSTTNTAHNSLLSHQIIQEQLNLIDAVSETMKLLQNCTC